MTLYILYCIFLIFYHDQWYFGKEPFIKPCLFHWGYNGVVVITTAQLHSPKSKLGFRTGSNYPRSVSGIHDGEDLWRWSQLEIRLNAFRWSTITQTIQHHPHHHHNGVIFYWRHNLFSIEAVYHWGHKSPFPFGLSLNIKHLNSLNSQLLFTIPHMLYLETTPQWCYLKYM